MAVEPWKAPNQIRMFPWLRAVFDSLTAYLKRAFRTTGLTGGTWALNSTWNIPTNTVFPIQWDTTIEDTDGFVSPVSTTWVCRVSGVYMMHTTFLLPVAAATRAFGIIRVSNAASAVVNGILNTNTINRVKIDPTEDRCEISCLVRVEVGDIMQVQVYHENGADAAMSTAYLATYKLPDEAAFITGDESLAALEQRVVSLEGATQRCGVQLRKTAADAQSMANNASTAVTFNIIDEDTDGFLSGGAGTAVLTIPEGKGGVYVGSATVDHNDWDGASTRTFGQYTSNRADFPIAEFYDDDWHTAARNGRGSVWMVHRFDPGDTIQFNLFQLSGAARTLNTAHMNMYRICE